MLQRQGWAPAADEDLDAGRLRAELIELLVRMDLASALARAQALFAADVAGRPMPPALRQPVAVAVGLHADAAALAALQAAPKHADGEAQRGRQVDAQASLRDPALVRQVQALALGEEWRADIAPRIPTRAGRDGPQPAIAYDFVGANFAVLVARSAAWRRPDAAGARGRAAGLRVGSRCWSISGCCRARPTCRSRAAPPGRCARGPASARGPRPSWRRGRPADRGRRWLARLPRASDA